MVLSFIKFGRKDKEKIKHSHDRIWQNNGKNSLKNDTTKSKTKQKNSKMTKTPCYHNFLQSKLSSTFVDLILAGISVQKLFQEHHLPYNLRARRQIYWFERRKISFFIYVHIGLNDLSSMKQTSDRSDIPITFNSRYKV